MKGNVKLFSLCIAIAVCVFFASFACTVAFIIKPRYEMMTAQGLFDQIQALQDTVLQNEAQIDTLQEELAIYKEYYEETK